MIRTSKWGRASQESVKVESDTSPAKLAVKMASVADTALNHRSLARSLTHSRAKTSCEL